jgi:hypothetical protein
MTVSELVSHGMKLTDDLRALSHSCAVMTLRMKRKEEKEVAAGVSSRNNVEVRFPVLMIVLGSLNVVSMVIIALRGVFCWQEVVTHLQALQTRDGHSLPPSFVAIISDLIRNICKSRQGKRWSTVTRDFITVILLRGGPKVCEFVCQNLGLGSLSTARRNRRGQRSLLTPGFQDIAAVIEEVVAFYEQRMRVHGLRPGSVPWQLSSDDTVAIAGLVMDGTLMYLLGSCGERGVDHVCELKAIFVPDGADGFRVIEQASKNAVFAHCT